MVLSTIQRRFGLPWLLVTMCVALGTSYGLSARLQAHPVSSGATVPHAAHRILFHVASNDPAAMSHAISTADNAMKFYQARGESVAIEIVANGAGVRMMRADTSPIAPSIAYLHRTYPSILLSACGVTLRLMKEHEGAEPPLLDGISVTPSGIARIVELEEAGWSYVRS